MLSYLTKSHESVEFKHYGLNFSQEKILNMRIKIKKNFLLSLNVRATQPFIITIESTSLVGLEENRLGFMLET